ncbi:hypothetical protein [Candidatus Nitrospira neomarina]|uniref:Uncharacterized protein n=1 Tax=Candidatus Nitrospira neomarina TaxID=3020899 RepID=A0AA96GM70_9BACT|nr:hypothetical protein [Candidatus Nitrospira neomarina]WNM61713.1 hypothetical protein PQG83_18500 [Candidatus Nitrospira neomarina]
MAGLAKHLSKESKFGWARIFRFIQDDNFSRIRISSNLLGLVTLNESLAIQYGTADRMCARFPSWVPGHPGLEMLVVGSCQGDSVARPCLNL